MKLLKEVKTVEEIEVQLPYYSKKDHEVYMLFGEDDRDCISVYNNKDLLYINTCDINKATNNTEPIDRLEFMHAYNTVATRLGNIITVNAIILDMSHAKV